MRSSQGPLQLLTMWWGAEPAEWLGRALYVGILVVAMIFHR